MPERTMIRLLPVLALVAGLFAALPLTAQQPGLPGQTAPPETRSAGDGPPPLDDLIRALRGDDATRETLIAELETRLHGGRRRRRGTDVAEEARAAALDRCGRSPALPTERRRTTSRPALSPGSGPAPAAARTPDARAERRHVARDSGRDCSRSRSSPS